MGVTNETTWVMGDIVTLHECDNCGMLIDGLPKIHWADKDFTLCYRCLSRLFNWFDQSKTVEAQSLRKIKEPIPDAIKWEIWERDNFTCQYCGERKRLSVDHINPESHGGQLVLNNLVTACRSCNAQKGARTPEEAGMKLAKDPREG